MRQRDEVLVDVSQLKSHGSGIAFIGEQQVGNGMGFEVREIPAAIGERTVGDLENRFEQNGVGSALHESVSQKAGNE